MKIFVGGCGGGSAKCADRAYLPAEPNLEGAPVSPAAMARIEVEKARLESRVLLVMVWRSIVGVLFWDCLELGGR